MPATSSPGLSRRSVLAGGGVLLAGALGGYVVGRQPDTDPVTSLKARGPEAAQSSDQVVPFHGLHQAGLDIPAQVHAVFIGMDLVEPGRQQAEAVLRLISDDAARLTQGQPALADTEPELAVDPARLTVTVGLGRSFFDGMGIPERRPPNLVPIPAFTTDAFEEDWGQTDVLLHIGSDNPVSLAHAVRMISKDLSTLAEVRWMQQGFRSPATLPSGNSRNLMGQVDGTVNPSLDQLDEVVWIRSVDPAVHGGTILVLRRIRMLLDAWDALDREAKEIVIGRRIADGAPLGQRSEMDPVPFEAVDDLGLPVIAANAHIRVAHAPSPAEGILRRPYNYDAGLRKGTNDMGLIFAAYTSDPGRSFIPMQQRLASSDAFNTWNQTIGSASYFIPPGCAEGGFIGEHFVA